MPGAGHTEWMHDDHPQFVRLIEVLVDWLARNDAAGRSLDDG